MSEAVWASLDVSAGSSADPCIEDAACQVSSAMVGDVCAVRGSIWCQHLGRAGMSSRDMLQVCPCSADTCRAGFGVGKGELCVPAAGCSLCALGRDGLLLTLCICVGMRLAASSWPFS